MNSHWFRFYDGVLEDPKVQRLPANVFKGWVNILCLASRNAGVLPPLSDIAFALRISDHEAESLVSALMNAGLIDDVGDHMEPHGWTSRQYAHDPSAAERMRRYRERKASERNERNALRVTAVTVTPVDIDTDTESDTEKKDKKGKTRKRASTIPDNFPSETEIRWTLAEHPKLSAWTEADKFRDYALQHAKTYSDWPAAWRTWCRNATNWSQQRDRRFA